MQPLVNHPAAFFHFPHPFLSYFALNTPSRSGGVSFITASARWILVPLQQCVSVLSPRCLSPPYFIRVTRVIESFPERLSSSLHLFLDVCV